MNRSNTLLHLVAALAATATLAAAPAAQARDTEYKIPFAEVMEMPEAKQQLDGSVKFYFGDEKPGKVITTLGDDVSNKKTNGVGKDDRFGCKWAALSALVALQDSAKRQGANAVINVVSYYKRDTFKSNTEFECHAGAIVIGVALKGTYAKVAP
ncbi:excinuclease ATPase subunit [Ideonella sp.]|uniref:excinuclease ATPase subunit n=1 Tax=Ideonella sp. TaxID=1929293 RepID=UPI0035B332DA